MRDFSYKKYFYKDKSIYLRYINASLFKTREFSIGSQATSSEEPLLTFWLAIPFLFSIWVSFYIKREWFRKIFKKTERYDAIFSTSLTVDKGSFTLYWFDFESYSNASERFFSSDWKSLIWGEPHCYITSMHINPPPEEGDTVQLSATSYPNKERKEFTLKIQRESVVHEYKRFWIKKKEVYQRADLTTDFKGLIVPAKGENSWDCNDEPFWNLSVSAQDSKGRVLTNKELADHFVKYYYDSIRRRGYNLQSD